MDCVFCRVLKWELPSVKIREDDDFLAILDIFPNRAWHALVITKEHFESDLSKMDDDTYSQFMLKAKKVIELLKKWLWVDRVGMVVEWLQVNHAHIRLYPFYDNVWFRDWVEWRPQADISQLEEIAKKILTK